MTPPIPIIYLYTAGGINGAIRFQKLVFLGQKETNLGSHYNFVPYKYGPYSYNLQMDIKKCIEDSEANKNKSKNTVGNYRIDYSLTPDGVRTAKQLLNKDGMKILFDQVKEVVSDHNGKRTSNLLNYVYNTYPEYTDKSTLEVERLFDEGTTSQFAEQDDSRVGLFNQINQLDEKEGRVAGIDEDFHKQLLNVGPDFQMYLERVSNTSISIYWRSSSVSFSRFKSATQNDSNLSPDNPSEMRTTEQEGWVRDDYQTLLETVRSDTCLFFRVMRDDNITISWESGNGSPGDEITIYAKEENMDYRTLRAALAHYATETVLNADMKEGSPVDTTDKSVTESLRQTVKLAVS